MSMDCLVRTKIKGNTVDSNDDGRILNFDDLPSAVLNEMENAILKIHSSSIANGDLKMSTLFHASFSDATGHRSKSPYELNADLNLDEEFTSPPSLLPASNVSQGVPIPFLRSHLPRQANTSDSMTYESNKCGRNVSPSPISCYAPSRFQ
mmetsp:Transcript_25662/g.43484  ORF Transcript_25662/g.43484 Transcript_25662/m.43484 type:complete len:150 (-) Transcript_25662:259-708(-)